MHSSRGSLAGELVLTIEAWAAPPHGSALFYGTQVLPSQLGEQQQPWDTSWGFIFLLSPLPILTLLAVTFCWGHFSDWWWVAGMIRCGREILYLAWPPTLGRVLGLLPKVVNCIVVKDPIVHACSHACSNLFYSINLSAKLMPLKIWVLTEI